MATVEELVRQYETDPELQAEIAKILEDGKVTITEFMTFAKNHNVEVSLAELPKYIAQAKELGLL